MATTLATGVLVAVLPMALSAQPAAAGSAPELTTDSGSAPLLSGSDLAPGRTLENCVALRYSKLPDGRYGIGMYGAPAGTGLADYLDLTIEAGSGGRFGDCTGFSGGAVFAGSLQTFGQSHPDPPSQILVAVVGNTAGEVVLRLRLRLRDDNRAQGKNAAATFSWTVGGVGPDVTAATVAPPPGLSDARTAPSAPADSASSAPDADQPRAGAGSGSAAPSRENPEDGPTSEPGVTPVVQGTVETASPDPQPTSDPGNGDDRNPGAAVGGTSPNGRPPDAVVGPPVATVTIPFLPGLDDPAAGGFASEPPPAGREGAGQAGPTTASGRLPSLRAPGPAAQLRDAIAQLVTTAQQAAPAAARGGALGLGTLPFVLLFLLLQKRLDERDPKLALAPSYEDDYLTFEDMPGSGSDVAFA